MKKAKSPSLTALILSLLAGVGVVGVFHTCSKKELPAVPLEVPSASNSSILALPEMLPASSSSASSSDVMDLGQMNQYLAFLDMGQKNLARVEDIKKLKSKDLHHTPPAVLGAGKFFAKIMESSKLSDEHLKATQKFFHDCVLMEEVVNTLRATCLVNLKNLHVESGGTKENFDDSAYPEKIKKLSKGF